MTTLVVDASVALKWVIEEEDSDLAEAILSTGIALEAPDLLQVEVANALWRRLRGGASSEEQADRAFVTLDGAIGLWHADKPLARRALELASSLGHPIYDMLYLALAERRGARVITADRRFAERAAASPHAPLIVTLSEWAAGKADFGR